ncbi:MFS transporter, partial [Burkholderia cenocepacia]|nr:MFS transporter [Burkholderia cenocepacia]
ALVIGPVFFPHGSATAQALSAFVTFGIAFIARPIGSFLFGHFGDRIGRKSTLVASLLVMGVSTTAIGFVPGYDAIGALAPVLLCVLRFGQGIGLGGEWGGAALLATEHAPQGKRGWFGMLLFLMGVTFAPMGALLPELFPTNVRYTGAGVAYNLGGILGASIAPYIAQLLAARGGLSWVGGYVSVAAAISLIGVLLMRETRDASLV